MDEFQVKMVEGLSELTANQENTNKSIDRLHTSFETLSKDITETSKNVAVNTSRIVTLEGNKKSMWIEINQMGRPKRTAATVAASITGGTGLFGAMIWWLIQHHLNQS